MKPRTTAQVVNDYCGKLFVASEAISSPRNSARFPSAVRTMTLEPILPSTLPTTVLPSFKVNVSGGFFCLGLLKAVQFPGTTFLPSQIGQTTFPDPRQMEHWTLVVPPQMLHFPMLTALPPRISMTSPTCFWFHD